MKRQPKPQSTLNPCASYASYSQQSMQLKPLRNVPLPPPPPLPPTLTNKNPIKTPPPPPPMSAKTSSNSSFSSFAPQLKSDLNIIPMMQRDLMCNQRKMPIHNEGKIESFPIITKGLKLIIL